MSNYYRAMNEDFGENTEVNSSTEVSDIPVFRTARDYQILNLINFVVKTVEMFNGKDYLNDAEDELLNEGIKILEEL